MTGRRTGRVVKRVIARRGTSAGTPARRAPRPAERGTALRRDAERLVPGQIVHGAAPIAANPGRRTVTVRVQNTSAWPVHVSSHYHFFEANRRLRFDRAAAFGTRLDILAGATVRWEPREEKEVRLVEYAGQRHVYGFNGLVDGPLTPEARQAALTCLRARGFLDTGR